MFVIDAIENFDVLIFSILLDITMYLFLRRQRFSRSRSTKLYLALILSVAAAAAIETAAWLFTDPNNPSLRSAQYALNVLYFSTNILPASFGLRYLDYIVSQSEEKSRRKLHLFLAPVYMKHRVCDCQFLCGRISIQRGLRQYIPPGDRSLYRQRCHPPVRTGDRSRLVSQTGG